MSTLDRHRVNKPVSTFPTGAAGSTLEELLSRPPLDANLEIVERVGNIVTVVRTSVGQLLYLCDLCGVQTEVATRSLKVHLESHYGTEKPFPCKYCNSYASERFDSLKKHFRTHTGTSCWAASFVYRLSSSTPVKKKGK